jgi:multidrug efflux pump
MPLVIATGAGAASRYNIGIVIVTGMTVGTCFTLFVVPAVYMLMAADRRKAGKSVPDLPGGHPLPAVKPATIAR